MTAAVASPHLPKTVGCCILDLPIMDLDRLSLAACFRWSHRHGTNGKLSTFLNPLQCLYLCVCLQLLTLIAPPAGHQGKSGRGVWGHSLSPLRRLDLWNLIAVKVLALLDCESPALAAVRTLRSQTGRLDWQVTPAVLGTERTCSVTAVEAADAVSIATAALSLWKMKIRLGKEGQQRV